MKVDKLESRYQILDEERVRLSSLVKEREELSVRLGTGECKPGDSIFQLDRIATVRAKVSDTIQRRQGELDKVEAEKYLLFRDAYLSVKNLKARGAVRDDEISPFEEEYSKYRERLATEPNFSRAVRETIRASRRNTPAISKTEKADTFVYQGIQGRIIGILKDHTHEDPITTLEISRLAYDREFVSDKKARATVGGIMGHIREKLEGTGYEIGTVFGFGDVVGQKGYYLMKADGGSYEQGTLDQPKYEFELPGGIVLDGEKGHLLTLLAGGSEENPIPVDEIKAKLFPGMTKEQQGVGYNRLKSGARAYLRKAGIELITTAKSSSPVGTKGCYLRSRN